MQVSVNEKQCWVCGEAKKNLTVHHTIPQHLKPKKNVLVPVCVQCHEKINDADLRGMYGFTHKISCTLQDCERWMQKLTLQLEKNIEHQEKLKGGGSNGGKETQ